MVGQAEHQVQAPSQVAAQDAPERRVAEPVGVAGHGIVGVEVLLQQVGQRAHVQGRRRQLTSDQRDLESQLVEAVAARDVAQPDVTDQGPER